MPVSKKRSKVAAKRVTLERKRSIVRRQKKAGTEIPLPTEMIYEMMLHLDPISLQKSCQTNRQFASVCSGLGRGFWERYAASYNVELPRESAAWTTTGQFIHHILCLVSWRNAWRIFAQEAEVIRDDPEKKMSWLIDEFSLASTLFDRAETHHLGLKTVEMSYWAHPTHYPELNVDSYMFTIRGKTGIEPITAQQVDNLKHTRRLDNFSELFGVYANFPVVKIIRTHRGTNMQTIVHSPMKVSPF
jgi:hypothetical protein